MEQRTKLDQLQVVPAGQRVSARERQHRGPTRPSAAALVKAFRRLAEIGRQASAFSIHRPFQTGLIRTLVRYAARTWALVIARMPATRRRATLVAFAHLFEAHYPGRCADVLDLMISELLTRVEKEGDQPRLRTLRHLDAAALRLHDACRVALDPRYLDLELRDLRRSRWRTHVEMAVWRSATWRGHRKLLLHDLLSPYCQMRQFLPDAPHSGLRWTTAGRTVLEALAFPSADRRPTQPDSSDTPRSVITRSWRSLVLDADNRNRNWDDLLRLAGPLSELGGAHKTLHSLSYFDDQEQRRYIGQHVRRHESRHPGNLQGAARFPRSEGAAPKAYPEGMEDQLGALGLVVNDDNIARLSPSTPIMSTSRGATTSRLLNSLPPASCALYAIRPSSTKATPRSPTSRDGHFRFDDCRGVLLVDGAINRPWRQRGVSRQPSHSLLAGAAPAHRSCS